MRISPYKMACTTPAVRAKAAAAAKRSLKAQDKACPRQIQRILTDNGKESTDRLFSYKNGQLGRAPRGEDEFY